MTLDDHDGPCVCPLCRDDVPIEIVEMIMEAAAGPMSEAMTIDEFKAWLAVFPGPPR